jgi:uncharacterized repeat protein (TIGR01451 family)
MVQFFAVISPPALTSAAPGPSNDLINNGFNSAAQAASDCDNNVQDYKNILLNYDISCKEVANAPTVNNFVSTGQNRDLFSMGRWQYGLTGEQPVSIDGATYYVRYLWSWDKNGPPTVYPHALRIIAGDGTVYWLLYGCGNLVSVGVPKAYTPPPVSVPIPPIGITKVPIVTPAPAPKPPKLVLNKTTLGGYPVADSNVAPGTKIGYRVYINNSGGSEADNTNLNDTLPADTTFVSQSLNGGASVHTYDSANRTVRYSWSTIPAGTNNNYSVDIVAQVNASATNGEKVCNTASAGASGLGTVTSNQVCMTVVVNAPPPVLTPVTTPPAPVPTTPTPTPAPTPVTTPTCQYDTSLPATSPDCKPCQASTSAGDTLSCVLVSKTAANLTENIADANNTTAQPGDVILYTLSAQNDANSTIDQYSFQENLADVMVYADPTDLHGGTLDPNTNAVSWAPVDIAPGATATEQVTVTVKNPIPAAVANPANPGEYDLTMTNVFGNTININVPPAPAQSIVTTSAALPNTGPGSGLFVAGAIVMIAGYFYGRARLLARESAMAIKNSAVG